MTIDTETTLVTFYKERDAETGETNIMAYFPLETFDRAGNKASYAHLGQHSACSPDYVKDLPIATKKEYTELLNELKSLGYNLKVV